MQTIRAILVMIVAMALLALSDLFVKLSSQHAPLGQVMFAMSAGGTGLYLAYARIIGQNVWSRDALHPMVIVRNACEAVAGVTLIIGIAAIPLNTFAAIVQVAPILVVLGGALFLKEQVGWRRWAAVLAGLIGMLIVVRPWDAAFSPYTILAVIGVSALAIRDLVTRLSPPHIPALALSVWGFASALPVTLLFLLIENKPLSFTQPALWFIGLCVLVTTAGYFAITTAMRMAPVSIVAPFRYTRLVFTTTLGLVFLGEELDRFTMIGAAIILCAGIYTFVRERHLALAADRQS